MDILDEIIDKTSNFVIKYGQTPKTLYLGQSEWFLLEFLFDTEFCFHHPKIRDEIKKRKVCGMRIIVVEDEKHLGFGLE